MTRTGTPSRCGGWSSGWGRSGQERAVGQRRSRGSSEIAADRATAAARRSGGPPEALEAVEAAVGQAQHPRRSEPISSSANVFSASSDAPQRDVDDRVRAALGQADQAQLRKRAAALPARRPRPPERLLVGGVSATSRHVPSMTHQPQVAVERAARGPSPAARRPPRTTAPAAQRPAAGAPGRSPPCSAPPTTAASPTPTTAPPPAGASPPHRRRLAKQRHREHVVDDHPRRQQPLPPLPRARPAPPPRRPAPAGTRASTPRSRCDRIRR